LQQRCDVLTNVVIARAFPKVFSTLIIMFQCETCDLF
jgi:hypothetical protein